MNIDLVRGASVQTLLAEHPFRAAWSALREQCPWATAFQSCEFAAAWYSNYLMRYQPVLVVGRDEAGQVIGILPLSSERNSGRLLPAGAHQAEYQGWICLPQVAELFPLQAFARVRVEFPSAELDFRYLPAGIPLEWAETQAGRRTCLLKPVRRPILQLGDGEAVRHSLAKSGNKNRLRQLKKKGLIEFKLVTEPDERQSLLDEAARCHDCRQLAIHGSAPFTEDGRKRDFHRALLNEPELLHVTVLRVGGEMASVHFNVTRGRELQLYLIAHHPRFARHSPGKLHVLFLAKLLQEQGYEQIDLTPGGDGYKERFANYGDHVQRLSVHPSQAARLRNLIVNKIEPAARTMLGRADLTPADVRCAAGEWSLARAVRLPGIRLARFSRWVWSRNVTLVFACDLPSDLPLTGCIGRDRLDDLLAYRPSPGQPTRRRFLADAMCRFEDGQHAYTRLESGRLVTFGWLAEDPSTQSIAAAFPEFSIPSGSAIICDFRFPESQAEREPALKALGAILRDAALARARRVYVAVPQLCKTSVELLEEAGFTCQGSIRRDIRLGRSKVQSKASATDPLASHWESPVCSSAQISARPVQPRELSSPHPRRKTG